MKTQQFAKLLTLVVLASTSLSACSSSSDPNEQEPLTHTNTTQTVTVERTNITPTISEKTTIEKAKPFVATTNAPGTFRAWVKLGQNVKAGQTLGYAGGEAVLAPADATVTALHQGTSPLPAHYPVVSLHANNFSLTIPALSFLASTNYNPAISGKFQIVGGAGPTNCAAIVFTEGEVDTTTDTTTAPTAQPDTNNDREAPAPQNIPTPGTLSGEAQCLIPLDIAVATKQQAVAVLNGTLRENTLTLPVSAVAGRVNKGHVTKINDDGTREEKEITLGINDGGRIEILDGLNEGDTVSALPPNLDPRGM